MSTPPERLSTARFTLRPFRRRDVEALEEAVRACLPDLHEWLPWAHLGYGREDAANYIRESGRSWKEERAFDFSIRRPEEPGRHLGNISIWFVSRPFRTGEIGYWVRSDETGKGIATEVTARMVKLGFEGLGMHRIVLRIAVGNRASERVRREAGVHSGRSPTRGDQRAGRLAGPQRVERPRARIPAPRRLLPGLDRRGLHQAVAHETRRGAPGGGSSRIGGCRL